MMTARDRMQQLAKEGYQCSQILIMMGLESKEDSNPDLVRAINGLAGGCDEGSCTCGSLTSGCCLIALFAGKGSPDEVQNENYSPMVKELVRWFWQKYGFKYGGIDCMALTESPGPEPAQNRCWAITEDIYSKVCEILAANGIYLKYDDCYAA
jgi:hypothetical protein